ncbi:T9SS type A sorting domain-containing protein [Polaribacter haliotis]|uniref:T9SS type A sorting domain-containing protein n=1 Tax=Polaribacter haliotis TaxID=1888915 RepID=A0A7L8AFX8_9FLAO|nr:GEVED domain-containing protein [Polaribacter haliotis]QOD60892.1 T9SS type A sorting domain-containing protein [Polaribacter haliotis]
MKNLLLLLLTLIIFSCKNQTQKELIFLNKNAYEVPVWEEMLLEDKIKFSDVISAFKAYKSNNILDKETIEHFEKLEKRVKEHLGEDGFYTSQLYDYKELLKYRKAIRVKKEEAPVANSLSLLNTVTKQIPNVNNLGNWKNMGPFGNPEVKWSATGNGALDYIEMHPTNPAIMYVCARNGGLWKTINYGKNWIPQTDYFASNSTTCVEVCEENPAILYLGTGGDQKIWYSSDEGNSWENRSTGISGAIYEIKSDPSNSNRALAATTGGLFLTIDSGQNWTLKVAGSYTDIDVTDNWDLIIVSDANDNIDPILSFSKDKGDTFTASTITTNYEKVDKMYVALHKPKTGATKVFAYGIKNDNNPTRFIGFWKSDFTPNPTDGTSFFDFKEVKHPTYNYPNGPVPLTVADNTEGYNAETSDYYGSVNPYSGGTWISDFYVSPTNPDRFITLREKIWSSGDGGIIWEQKPSYGSSNWADNRFITTNVAKDSIFWCNDGGVWAAKESEFFPTEEEVSASGLSRWYFMNRSIVPKNGDICIIEGSQMDVSQLNKGVFMTGGQDLGQFFTRNGRDSHVASADVYRGRIKPTDDSKFITGSLLVNLDGGTDVFSVYNNIEPDHFNADKLYGFTTSNTTSGQGDVRLVRSPEGKDGWLVNNFKGENSANSGGHNWTATNNNWETISFASVGVTSVRSGTFEQSRANKEIAFFGDEVGNRLFFTANLSDKNPTWTEVTNAPKANKYRIATHQFNENIIVLATNIGAFISKDKGENWRKIATLPTTNPSAVLMDKNTSEGIYVSTSLTVYYIDENLTEWTEFNKGLPLQNVSDMRIAYYPDGDHRLYVSKYGRGVWASSLQSVLNNEQKPIADFSLFGNQLNVISVGEEVKFLDQSLNANSLKWTVENGTDVYNLPNKKDPSLTLSKKGFYKVTLVATNENGSSTKVKEQFINVLEEPVVNCSLDDTQTLPWYKGFGTISINEDTYNVNKRNFYVKTDKLFILQEGSSNTLATNNRHASYNFYSKAWIDFNNDGNFDATEEIASSNGKDATLIGNFTIPTDAVLSKQITLRFASLESNNPPTACQDEYTRQTIDFKIIIQPKPNFNVTHTILSENSVKLQTNFTNGKNVKEAGFVYSRFDGNLTVENSNTSTFNTALSNEDNFSKTIENLDYNGVYYYIPFIINEYGVFYGDKGNFELEKYKIPSLESQYASINLDNKWELKGVIYPEGNNLDKIFIDYGTSDFSNSIELDPTSYPIDQNFEVVAEIENNELKQQKFRVRILKGDQTYVSNPTVFKKNEGYCTPTVDSNKWYKKISKVTFNGISKSSSSNASYEDFSDIIFNVSEGISYPISVEDSYNSGYDMSYIVYIDYNNDGDFNGINETVAFGTPNASIFEADITIPTENVLVNKNLKMRVVAYGNSASPCNINTGQFEDYTIKIDRNIWEGTVSADWDTPENWSLNAVPTITTNVSIDKRATNNPVANGDIHVNNLHLKDNKGLTVNGATTNNGIIEISSGASFITKKPVSGTIKYSRDLSEKDKWYLVSPPVKNVDIKTLIEGHYFAKGSGTNIGIATYKNDGSAWNYFNENATGSLTSGKGYSVRLLGPNQISFSGNMITRNVWYSINTTVSNFNLIGNPYPSYLAVNNSANASANLLKKNTFDNDFLEEATIWVWNQSLNSGKGDYEAINHASKSRFIAPTEAFFVKSKGNQKFIFAQNTQYHQETDAFYKVEGNRFEIKLNVNDGVSASSTEIFYIDGTTKGWDNGFDSTIFEGSTNNLKVYSELVSDNENQKLKIQSLPTSKFQEMVIPIGLNVEENATVTFTIETKNMPSGFDIFLEDRVLNSYTKLRKTEDNVVIDLVRKEHRNRFFIHVKTSQVLATKDFNDTSVKLYYSENTKHINILGVLEDNAKIQLFDAQGKEVFSKRFKGNGTNKVFVPTLSAGVYIAKITNKNNKSVTKKILVK